MPPTRCSRCWKSRRRAPCCCCCPTRRAGCCPPSARAASGWSCGRWTTRLLEQALAQVICRTLDAAERAALARLVRRLDRRGAGAGRRRGRANWPREADRLIDRRATPDLLALLALGRQALAHPATGWRRFGDFLVEAWRRASAPARISGAPDLERWVALLRAAGRELSPAPRGLHLEPRQTLLSAARDLSRDRAPGGSACDAGRQPLPSGFSRLCRTKWTRWWRGPAPPAWASASASAPSWSAFPACARWPSNFADVWCSVGVHPHEAEKELLTDAGAAAGRGRPSQGGRRSAKPGWIIITNIRRASRSSREFPRPYRGRARDRAAGDRAYPRRR